MGGIVSKKKNPEENVLDPNNINEEKDESLEESFDPIGGDSDRLNTGDSNPVHIHTGNDDDHDDDGDSKPNQRGGFFNLFTKEELVDPSMPYVGPSVGYYKILDRTKKAKLTFRRVADAVELDTVDGIMVAKSIPTPFEKQRINVPKHVVTEIERKKTKKAIKASTDNNNVEIQKVLHWRKLIVDMMNTNFHGVKARQVQNVKSKDSRAMVFTK